jgi:hypothetical protein
MQQQPWQLVLVTLRAQSRLIVMMKVGERVHLLSSCEACKVACKNHSTLSLSVYTRVRS